MWAAGEDSSVQPSDAREGGGKVEVAGVAGGKGVDVGFAQHGAAQGAVYSASIRRACSI